jgi:hypothetical protein
VEVTTDPDEHLSSRQAGSLNRPMMDLSLGTDMEKFILLVRNIISSTLVSHESYRAHVKLLPCSHHPIFQINVLGTVHLLYSGV